MHRRPLLSLLSRYEPSGIHDAAACNDIAGFVHEHPDCFERSLQIGHVTGSAWIVDSSRTRCLLTLHRKLGRWLQLGGHADGNGDLLDVATREAREESGLFRLRAVATSIFDCDVHVIPARGAEPEHRHYDVRFLLEGDALERLVVSAESRELAWVALAEVAERSGDASVRRMVVKSLRTRTFVV